MKLFDKTTIQNFKEQAAKRLNHAFVRVSYSPMGGDYGSLFFDISLDSPGQWANGIYYNSRYITLMLENDGTLETSTHSGVKRVRKCKIKHIDQLINKLNKISAA